METTDKHFQVTHRLLLVLSLTMLFQNLCYGGETTTEKAISAASQTTTASSTTTIITPTTEPITTAAPQTTSTTIFTASSTSPTTTIPTLKPNKTFSSLSTLLMETTRKTNLSTTPFSSKTTLSTETTTNSTLSPTTFSATVSLSTQTTSLSTHNKLTPKTTTNTPTTKNSNIPPKRTTNTSSSSRTTNASTKRHDKPTNSPKTTNHWTTQSPNEPVLKDHVVLSEVYFSRLTHGKSSIPDYVELIGQGNQTLNNITLVIYQWDKCQPVVNFTCNSSLSERGPVIIDLNNYTINPSDGNNGGYFTIGEISPHMTVDLAALEHGNLDLNGSVFSMVALLNCSMSDLPFIELSEVFHKYVVDYVVYGNMSYVPEELLPWFPNVQPIDISMKSSVDSISRCFSDVPKNYRSFTISPASPGQDNTCSKQRPLVNEVGLNQKAGTCFVEILTKATTPVCLNPYILVITRSVNGSTSNLTIDLWNYHTNAAGIYWMDQGALKCEEFVPGTGTVVMEIYQITDANSPFFDGIPSKENIVWSLAYFFGNKSPTKDNTHFLPLDSNQRTFKGGTMSITWCQNIRKYILARRTPGLSNNCSQPKGVSTQSVPMTTRISPHGNVTDQIYINEIMISTTENFIEIRGPIWSQVDHYDLVIFDGCSGKFLQHINVQGKLDRNGIREFKNTNILQQLQKHQSIGLGLYEGSFTSTIVTSDSLVDAVVIETSNGTSCEKSYALKVLTPESVPMMLDISQAKQSGFKMSFSRCSLSHKKHTEDYIVTKSSPGEVNNFCPHPTEASVDKKNNQVTLTVGVVTVCFFVFFLMFLGVVYIMKRKRRQIINFRLARMDDDDDDELITNHALPEMEEEGGPTFSYVAKHLQLQGHTDDSVVEPKLNPAFT